MAHDSLTLFTMPPGVPFLERLADTLLRDPSLGGCFGKAPALADFTILLPTRRAVRALNEAFLRVSNGTPLILPDIRPLGDVDEDGLSMDPVGAAEDLLALPPSMPSLERQLRLARLILDIQGGDAPRALALAADLGRFLDMVLTEGADLSRLSEIVPLEFADHWQITIDFLKTLTQRWPEELERLGYIEQTQRRNLLLEALTKTWAERPPKGPVIAAGSTGSIPATADLLKLIARLPMGVVLLPGLDLTLDDESWAIIGEPGTASHPQYGMKKLLSHMQATRADVMMWPGSVPSASAQARAMLLSDALRPAETTDKWRQRLPVLQEVVADGCSGLSLFEARGGREEALGIALMMRETLETPARTAALVTPDRTLARRVSAELRRWKIDVNDSGGEPLSKTPSMSFMRLVAEMILEKFAPVSVLACLKHPLASAGMNTARFRSDVRLMELLLLRGPRPAPGIDGLRRALDALEKHEGDKQRLSALLDRIEAALAPFISVMEEEGNVTNLISAHISAAEMLAADNAASGSERLWRGEEGDAAADFMRRLMASAQSFGTLDPVSYPRFLDELLSGEIFRPRWGTHPRLFIWGPLEARLQHVDRLILGGMNEDVWPAEANVDPWLNRPMRAALGLEPPERRIGLSAHDFVSGANMETVVLSRSLKQGGAPSIASRWWLRLTSLLQGLGHEASLHTPHWESWAIRLDEPVQQTILPRPRPSPPVEMRPRRFSVTEIETLIRDPYSIYAKKILGLRPLDPLDADIAAAERGTLIHEALEKFTRAYPKELPDDALDRLIEIGGEVFSAAMDRPGVVAFWWPRFLRIAEWMIEYEQQERPNLQHIHAEISGQIVFEGLLDPVTLTGKADRVNVRRDGLVDIIDYKTGVVPSKNQVSTGLAPQLPLEAAIMCRGGFVDERGKKIAAARAAQLVYLRLRGGETAGEKSEIKDDDGEIAEAAYENLASLLRKYDDLTTPYLSRPRPMFQSRYGGDYDHLARVAEWALDGEGE